MTDSPPDLIALADALSQCRMLPGSAPKRAAREIVFLVRDGRELTAPQMVYLCDLVHTFRRQIDPAIVRRARELRAIWEPLAEQERAARRRAKEDKIAKREALRRAKQRDAIAKNPRLL